METRERSNEKSMLFCVAAVTLFALGAQADAKEGKQMMTNRVADPEDSVDRFVNQLVDELAEQALKAWPSYRVVLKRPVLAKGVHLSIFGGVICRSVTPHVPNAIPSIRPIHGWPGLRRCDKFHRLPCTNAAGREELPSQDEWQKIHQQLITKLTTGVALGRTISLVMLSLLIGLGPAPLMAEMALAEPGTIMQTVDKKEPEVPQKETDDRVGQSVVPAKRAAVTRSTSEEFFEKKRIDPSRRYNLITGFPFPLGPFFERKTVETELVKDRVYSFEQVICIGPTQDLIGITANVRSTVFRMRDNHLLVYNPVAPTEEFLTQLKSLNSNGVSHILLGATTYEHKVFVGPFSRQFPKAKVWVVPDQYSFPLDLPPQDFGIDTKGSGGGELLDTATGSPAYSNAPDLTDEFEVKLLRPMTRLGGGSSVNEAAVFHKDSKTLALTDALINIPEKATPIYDDQILYSVGDNTRNSNSRGNFILNWASATNFQGNAALEVEKLFSASNAKVSDMQQLQRGWERNVLFSIYFGPATASIIDPDVSSFKPLAGKWIVPPVGDALVYKSSKVRPELRRWIDDITKWDFKMISPSHFDAQPGTPDDVRAAFASTLAAPDSSSGCLDGAAEGPIAADRRFLNELSCTLIKSKVI